MADCQLHLQLQYKHPVLVCIAYIVEFREWIKQVDNCPHCKGHYCQNDNSWYKIACYPVSYKLDWCLKEEKNKVSVDPYLSESTNSVVPWPHGFR